MPNNVESMRLLGDKAITGTGQGGDDAIGGTEFNNTLDGGAGSDLLDGEDGNDILKGGLGIDYLSGGNGLDTLEGGSGADMYYFESDKSLDAVDIVKGFSTAEGDSINLSEFLTLFDPLTEALTDFVKFETVSGNTVVSVDQDGTGTGSAFTAIATLQGVTGLTNEDLLLTNGNIDIALHIEFVD